MDYAVFKTGGKQYRVKAGDTLDVEKLPLEVDSAAEFENVLAVSDGGEVIFGAPYVAGAKVLAQVQSHLQDRKVVVFKYKRKTRYRRKKGHRQEYTRLVIKGIQLGPAPDQPSPRRSRARGRQAAAQAGGNE
jgi:large subunit ribosomal protein L21